MGIVRNILSTLATNYLAQTEKDTPHQDAQTSKKASKEDLESRYFNGKIAPMPIVQTRWSLKDLENAVLQASVGDLRKASQLMDSAKGDGIVKGVLSTRSDGLVRLPQKWIGRDDMVLIMEGDEKTKGIFDTLCPPGELGKMAADAALLSVSVARMVAHDDKTNPYVTRQLHRLDPQFLMYFWAEDKWKYQTTKGPIEITPGQNGWVLYLAGGYDEPWNQGAWRAVGRAFITKEHAFYNRQNYSQKIAFPARIGYTTENSTEKNRLKFVSQLIQWGSNAAMALPQGWDVKMLESNGRGFEIYQDQIKSSDLEIMVALTGQTVTTIGSPGFSDGSIHQQIRLELIQSTAESLAQCINQQVLRPWTNEYFGGDAMEQSPQVEWDTTPPEDNKERATMHVALLNSPMIQESMRKSGQMVDPEMLREEYGIQMVKIPEPEPIAPLVDPNVPSPTPEGTQSGPADVELPKVDSGPDYAQKLAEAMTAAQMKYCEHGRANVCEWCGVERDRELGKDENGGSKYLLKWRPIYKTETPEIIASIETPEASPEPSQEPDKAPKKRTRKNTATESKEPVKVKRTLKSRTQSTSINTSEHSEPHTYRGP